MTSARWARALITGASSGLGRQFALELAALGSDLVVVARRRDRLEALATELEARLGTAIEIIEADLGDEGDLQRVVKRLQSEPAVDLLVNCAGSGTVGPF